MSLGRWLFLLLLIGGSIPVTAPPAWACTCAASSRGAQFLSADVVFEGEVAQVKIEHPQAPLHSSADPLIATFQVERVYKGGIPNRVEVHTAAGGGSCGIGFQKGRRYSVFARRAGTQLQTGLCDGTSDGALPLYLRSLRFGWVAIPALLIIVGVFAIRHLRHRGRPAI